MSMSIYVLGDYLESVFS